MNYIFIQTEIRVYNQGTEIAITKGCKQPLACWNNYIQNPRAAYPYTQCQNMAAFAVAGDSGSFPTWNNPNPQYLENSVCRCCCDTPLCNKLGILFS